MPTLIDDSEEADVPAQALQALRDAQARSRASGRPRVLVVGRLLVRVTDGKRQLLRELPARKKVSVRKVFIKP